MLVIPSSNCSNVTYDFVKITQNADGSKLIEPLPATMIGFDNIGKIWISDSAPVPLTAFLRANSTSAQMPALVRLNLKPSTLCQVFFKPSVIAVTLQLNTTAATEPMTVLNLTRERIIPAVFQSTTPCDKVDYELVTSVPTTTSTTLDFQPANPNIVRFSATNSSLIFVNTTTDGVIEFILKASSPSSLTFGIVSFKIAVGKPPCKADFIIPVPFSEVKMPQFAGKLFSLDQVTWYKGNLLAYPREEMIRISDLCAAKDIKYELLENIGGQWVAADEKKFGFFGWNSSQVRVTTNTTGTFNYAIQASSPFVAQQGMIKFKVIIDAVNNCDIILTPIALSKVFTVSALTQTFIRPFVSLDLTREQLVVASSDCDQVKYEIIGDPTLALFNVNNQSLIDVAVKNPEVQFTLVASSPSSPMGVAKISITVFIQFDNSCMITFNPVSFKRHFILPQQSGAMDLDFFKNDLNMTREQIVNPSTDCAEIVYELRKPDTSVAGTDMPLAPANLTGFRALNTSRIYVNTNDSTLFMFVLRASSKSAKEPVNIYITVEIQAVSLCKIFFKAMRPLDFVPFRFPVQAGNLDTASGMYYARAPFTARDLIMESDNCDLVKYELLDANKLPLPKNIAFLSIQDNAIIVNTGTSGVTDILVRAVSASALTTVEQKVKIDILCDIQFEPSTITKEIQLI